MGKTLAGPITVGLFGSRRDWSRELAFSAGAGIFLGIIGPFGSLLNPSRHIVMLYWIGAVIAGALVFGVTLRPILRLADRPRVSPVLALTLGTALAAVPLSLLCHAIAVRLWPLPIGRIGAAAWYAQTLVTSTPFALAYRLRCRADHEQVASAAAQPVGGSNLLTRLPEHLGRDLVALQMEDHYVRVHTRLGSALVLMPLREAMRTVPGIPGLQVHRSWWVARQEVAGARQDGRNVRLLLSNGLEAPVSRINLPAAREGGLLSWTNQEESGADADVRPGAAR